MLISKEQRDLIEDSIYYDLLIKCCQKDSQFIRENPGRMYLVSERLLDKVIIRAEKRLFEIHANLSAKNITVEKVSQEEKFITYNFKINGLQEHHTYYKVHMKNKVKNIFEKICMP